MKMAVNVLVTICNFVASKWIVFRKKPSKSAGECPETFSGIFPEKRERGRAGRPFEGRLWAPYLLLAIITAGLLLLPVGTGNFFGSLGDWYSQHVAVATACVRLCWPQEGYFPSGFRWEQAAVPMIFHTTGCCGRMC